MSDFDKAIEKRLEDAIRFAGGKITPDHIKVVRGWIRQEVLKLVPDEDLGTDNAALGWNVCREEMLRRLGENK